MVAGMILACAVVLAVSLPFTMHSGLTWFRESYVNNLLESYQRTTLKAFNLWYLDLLITENPDAGAMLWGIQKDTWGKLLLGAAIAGSAWMLVRRHRACADGLAEFTAVLLLAAVVLPTRVHERYILLPIPFLIVMAAIRGRILTALVPFIVVASFQLTVLDGLGLGADSWAMVVEKVTGQYEELRATLPPEEFAALPPPAQQLEQVDRPRFLADRARMGREKWEWTLTLVELASAAAMGIMILARSRSRPSSLGTTADDPEHSTRTASRSPSGRG
jgi:hypothetical protein